MLGFRGCGGGVCGKDGEGRGGKGSGGVRGGRGIAADVRVLCRAWSALSCWQRLFPDGRRCAATAFSDRRFEAAVSDD